MSDQHFPTIKKANSGSTFTPGAKTKTPAIKIGGSAPAKLSTDFGTPAEETTSAPVITKPSMPVLTRRNMMIGGGVAAALALAVGAHNISVSLDASRQQTALIEAAQTANLKVKHGLATAQPSEIVAGYYDSRGREVAATGDFDMRVALRNNGGISVLILKGPYAGTRVNFLPAVQGGAITIERQAFAKPVRVGTETVQSMTELGFNDKIEKMFKVVDFASSTAAAVTQQVSWQAKKTIKTPKGNTAVAFDIKGDPFNTGFLQVQTWNGDLFAIDLSTGRFQMKSVYIADPTWTPQKTDSVTRNLQGTLPLPANLRRSAALEQTITSPGLKPDFL